MAVAEGRATVHIEASPEAVYDLVSDITRMGEWSPECTSASWVDGATGPSVGAKFKGRNKAGLMRWTTTPSVVVTDRGKEFAFRTKETVWSYRMTPAGDGTDLTETFEVETYGKLMNLVAPMKKRQPVMEKGMEQTLARIKAAAERTT
jgi:uncharacterized protein YndB with AHSA1/START domain